MTVKELIETLGKADPEARVVAWDPDSGQAEEVTGMTYGGSDNLVELFTDDLS